MENHNLILAYIQNTLSADERAKFNERLEQDDALQTEFDEAANAYALLQSRKEADEKAKKATVRADMEAFLKKQPKPPIITRIAYGLSIAASLLLLVTIGYLWRENNPSLEMQAMKLDRSGYTHDKGFEAYNKSDYRAACEEWAVRFPQDAPVEKEASDRLLFAISLIKTEKYEAAKAQLDKLEDLKEGQRYPYAVLWYQCIAHYQMGDKTTAKEYFKKFQLEKDSDPDFFNTIKKDYDKLYPIFD